jgi:hypothetical protein
VLVAAGPCDGSKTLLGDTHEVVLCLCSANGIDGYSQTTVCAVLEANRERQAGCELAVQLRLCCACADGAEGDEVCEELGGDCVEHFRGNGHALGREVNVELSRDTKTLVDLEALVDVRVVDESLPSYCCPGLLEVCAHNDADVVLELVGEGLQALAVLNGRFRVVDGAGPDHDEETVILLGDDLGGFLAALDDGLLGVCGDGELVGEERGRDQRVVAKDWRGQSAWGPR